MILNKYFDNCSLSIDKISFSIFILGNASEKELFEALPNLGFGKCKYDYRIKNKKMKYKRIRKYIFENSVIVFTYKRRKDTNFLPNICCTFQDPSRPVLNLLDLICNSLGFITKASQIEISVDFDYCPKLHEFFKKHLYVKYNRGNPCFVGKGDKKSYYSGHKAKNSKITNVYPKVINGINHLRFELIFNRKIIKRLNLDLRMEGVNSIDLGQFFCFKRFSYKRFYKYLVFRNRRRLAEMSFLSKSLCLRLLSDIELPSNVMFLISHLKQKGYSRPQRFLLDMPKTSRRFHNLVQGKQFLR